MSPATTLEQLQQWHGVEIGFLAQEHAEVLACASRNEATAESLARSREGDARCVATAVKQLYERVFATTRAELATGRAELRSLSEELQSERRSSSEMLKAAEDRRVAEMQSIKHRVQQLVAQMDAKQAARERELLQRIEGTGRELIDLRACGPSAGAAAGVAADLHHLTLNELEDAKLDVENWKLDALE